MDVIFSTDTNPNMRYEGLVRTAFGECNKHGDPWGYAAQDFYHNFVPNPNLLGKRALSITLSKFIIDHRAQPNITELIRLEDSIWDLNTQKGVIDLIDRTIEILREF